MYICLESGKRLIDNLSTYSHVYEQVHVTWLKFIRNLHQVLSIKDTNVEHFRSSLLYSFLFTRAQIHTYNEERIIIIV